MKEKTKLISAFIIVALVGLGLGFSLGTYKALDWAVNRGIEYLDFKNITIDISREELKQYVLRFFK